MTNAVVLPAFSDNTIGSLRSGAHVQRTLDAQRLGRSAILFAPSRRTRACCSHEYALADPIHAHAAAPKDSTMSAAGERKNPCR
jgi:hypothetical protein